MRSRIRSISYALVLCGGGFLLSGSKAEAAEDRRVSGSAVNAGPFSVAVPACQRMQIAFGSISDRPLSRFGLPFAERNPASRPAFMRLMHAARDGQMAFAGSTRGYGGYSVQTVIRWHITGADR